MDHSTPEMATLVDTLPPPLITSIGAWPWVQIPISFASGPTYDLSVAGTQGGRKPHRTPSAKNWTVSGARLNAPSPQANPRLRTPTASLRLRVGASPERPRPTPSPARHPKIRGRST